MEITLNEFIERSKVAWKAARAYIQFWDDPSDPTKFDLNRIPQDFRPYQLRKLKEIGIEPEDIAYVCGLQVSDESAPRVGYKMVNFYLLEDYTVYCAVFSSCTESFLNITQRLGMVNGVPYTNRKKLRSENAEVYYF